MGKKDNGGGFIVQASILALTGIFCRIIGLLYRSPLANIIGDEGNGYYNSAYNIYTIVLLISSYSIPSAISKVIAERLALKQYKNAHRIFKCAVLYVVIVGGIASLFTFTCAGWLVEEKDSTMVLQIFAPTVFFSGLLGVLRGYFQAHGTMLQTSCSQIIEQILNAAVSLAAAYLFMQSVAGQGKTTQAIYGAAGSALGTGVGVLTALVFMLLMYLLNKKFIRKRIEHDKRKEVDSYSHIFRIIILMVTPVILSTFIYNSSTVINQTIYQKIMKYFYDIPTDVVAANYGVFAGKSVVIINIPIALASAMSAAMIPMISGSYAMGDEEETNGRIQRGIKTTMLISIPCAVGLFVLAKPVMLCLFPQRESLELASDLLRVLSVSVVFYALSTLTNGVLQGIGKVNKPVINAAVALLIQTCVLVSLLLFTDFNLYCLAIAMITYSFAMCILNQRSIRQCLAYRLDLLGIFIKPSIASLIMGAIAWGMYYLAYMLVPINVVCLAISVILAVAVYFILVIKIGVVNEEEMLQMPKGTVLIRAARKLRLI
ncbi:MAG: polysaccharide biosynthesis protein [Clostridium sp.]|nr:polysaccharide biosynthesis protein [Clostridium sp.]